MNDALSQDDIDKLLAGGDDTEAEAELEEKESGAALATTSSSGSPKKAQRIKVYDFKRPDKFSKDQVRTIQMIHETFARLTTTSLSAQLRLLVNVHIVAVEQLTYQEFIRSIANPTTLAILNMEPLKGSAVYELDPSVTFVIIDRMFGGQGDVLRISRELTDIENTAMETVIVRILNNLREAWTNVIDLRPKLSTIETNPQFAQIVPPNDMVVLITFEIRIGDAEGAMNICIPYLTIEPVINKLSAQYWYSSVHKGVSEKNYQILNESLKEAKAILFAQVGKTSLTINEILHLEEGDIVRLPGSKLEENILLTIAKKPKFKVMPGISGNKIAVQIVDYYETAHTIDDGLDEGV